MSTLDLDRADRDLAAALTGTLVRPGDPGWDEARRAWNLAADQRPDLVVLAETADDVVAAVRHAAVTGRRVTAQGTGHGAMALGSLAGTILVKTSALRGVSVDATARTARVEAGALWQDLTPLAAEHGLAALAGSAGDVGVVGYTLGGGIGWLARRHGLACNSVTAAEVVTADGEHLRIDAEHHPELFWALRGGGGSFAIVTALELALHPLAEVHAGMLLWPIERAAEVLHAWRRWTGSLPDGVTSVGRVLRFPPLPELPPFLSGRSLVVVEAALADGQDDALLADLRALGPEMDTFATIPVPALAHLHMDPPAPVPGVGDHLLLSSLPAEALDALLAVAGAEADCPMLSVEVRHLGGALAVSDPGHGAMDRVDAPYCMFAVGSPATPELAAAISAHLPRLRAALEPWDAGVDYVNFAEQPTTGERLFGSALERLRAVRRTYDPSARLVSGQSEAIA
jgi:FAD/FMN-containing dehydrogenase